MFKAVKSKYLVFLISIVILFIKTNRVDAEWQVGYGLSYFSEVGNLPLNKIAFEHELILNHRTEFNAINQLSFSWLKPGLEADNSLTSLDLATVWFERGAEFQVRKYRIFLGAGIGVTRITAEKNKRKLMYGAFSYRTELYVKIWEKYNINYLAGFSFKGTPLANSDKYSDRFGFTLIVIG